MKRGLGVVIALVVVVIVLFLVGGSYWSSKNQMVSKNEEVNQAFSQVQVQQQRRLDLIPNLVASVKGYVKEEETVLTNIANARAAVLATPSDKPNTANIQANEHLTAVLGPLYRMQENYPDLKGNQQFMRLEDELSGTENRIAQERRRYNETLKSYNIYVQQFPNSIWANFAGYHYRDEYFKGNPASANAPTVDFSK
jgi:LemA protein